MDYNTTQCANCTQYISNHIYNLHTAVCSKHCYFCNECNMIIQNVQHDEHYNQFHTITKCTCGETISNHQYNEHLQLHCPNRLIKCEYCGIMLMFKLLEEHEMYCGSRTDICEYCNNRFLIKDLENHVKNTHLKMDIDMDMENYNIDCPYCYKPFNMSELQEHVYNMHPE